MDILDIDSILKDDSFCFLEEKMLTDDVTNIIQQWKINNKQDALFDSRTYTRGKRRLASNSELPQQKNNTNASTSNIKMQIGGLVSQNQKNFLADTSPPNSVSCSIEFPADQMLNSLITSADFSNVSFLNANSLETASETFVFQNSESGNHHDKYDTYDKTNTNSTENNKTDSNLTAVLDKSYNQGFNKRGFDKSLTFKLSETNEKLNNNSINCNGTFTEHHPNKFSTFMAPNDDGSLLDHAAYIQLENDSQDYYEKRNSIIKTNNFDEIVPTDVNSTFVKNRLPADNLNNTGTPENADKTFAGFSHSTPIVNNCYTKINLSPIAIDQNEKDHIILEKTFNQNEDVLNNDYVATFDEIENINTELHSFESNEKKINVMLDNIYNTEENIKMKNALDTIKKRLTTAANKPMVLCDFSSNSSSQSMERLLNKRGRINETIETQGLTNMRNSFECNGDETLNVSLNQVSLNKSGNSKDLKLDNHEQNHENHERFKTLRLLKKENQLSENNDLLNQKADANCRYTRKHRNSPIPVVSNCVRPRPTELSTFYVGRNDPCKFDPDSIYCENMCKAASANDLDNTVSKIENTTFIKPELKSPMGTKSKSFHNLSVNNFGFARKLNQNNIIAKTQQLRNVQSDEKTSYTKSNPSQNLPPASSKRSGLIRPSTGIYSHTSSNYEMAPKPNQHLSHDHLKPSSFDGLVSKYHADPTEKSQSSSELEIKSKSKMIRDMKELKLRPSGLKAPSNIKRTGLHAPSSIYKT